MFSDDEPYLKDEYDNAYLIDICRDSYRVSEELSNKKKKVLDKLLGETQFYLFHLGNLRKEASDNVIETNFTSGSS